MDERMGLLTALMPVHIDTNDRIENLAATVKYLEKKSPYIRCMIIESDSTMKVPVDLQQMANVDYVFQENAGSFSKCAMLNVGLRMAKTPLVAIYDVDTIVSDQAIREGISRWRSGWDIIFPHNMVFVNLKGKHRKLVCDESVIPKIPYFRSPKSPVQDEDIELKGIPSGIVIIDRVKFLGIGGMNELMKGYGWEDIEVFKRGMRLGLSLCYLRNFNLFHLDHRRGPFSQQGDSFQSNQCEYFRMLKLSKKELVRYADALRMNQSLGLKTPSSNVLPYRRSLVKYGIYIANRLIDKICSYG
jgi:predicted glycosyltransferase involved in capsule biosynthesis